MDTRDRSSQLYTVYTQLQVKALEFTVAVSHGYRPEPYARCRCHAHRVSTFDVSRAAV